MKERNEEGRVRFRLTDLFLILLLLLCIAGMIFRWWSLRHNAAEELQTFVVSAEWREVDNRTVACLHEGDWLYTAAGEAFGQVAFLESLPAEVRLLEGGSWYEGSYPEDTVSDVSLTVYVSARVGEGILLRGGTHALNIGEIYRLYSGQAEVHLRLLSYALTPVPEGAARQRCS